MQKKNLCDESNAFPNPFKYGFNLDLSSFVINEPFTVTIYSVEGRMVYTNVLSTGKNDVSSLYNEQIYNLKPGVYFVDISFKDCFNMIKVIKE